MLNIFRIFDIISIISCFFPAEINLLSKNPSLSVLTVSRLLLLHLVVAVNWRLFVVICVWQYESSGVRRKWQLIKYKLTVDTSPPPTPNQPPLQGNDSWFSVGELFAALRSYVLYLSSVPSTAEWRFALRAFEQVLNSLPDLHCLARPWFHLSQTFM